MPDATYWIGIARKYREAGSKDFTEILERVAEDGRVDDFTALIVAAKITMWLENSLNWHTTCTNDARLLDSLYQATEVDLPAAYNRGYADGYIDADNGNDPRIGLE